MKTNFSINRFFVPLRPAAMLLIALLSFRIAAFSTLDLAYVNSKWGFIDRNGSVVVEPVYSKVEDFSEGLAAVKVDGTHVLAGKWGFIDPDGRMVIEPQFDFVRSFHEGLATVQIGGKWGAINTSGTLVVPAQHGLVWEFHEGLSTFLEFRRGEHSNQFPSRYGYLNCRGEIVIPPQFDSASWFSEGLAAVTLTDETHSGAKGYIDTFGRIVIRHDFDLAFPFSEGLAAFQIDRKIGYIDRSGRIVIQPQFYFSWQQDFHDGLATVAIDDSNERYAVIDKHGTIVRRLPRRFTNGVLLDPADGSLTGLHFEKTSGPPLRAPFTPEQAHSSEGMIPFFQNPNGINSIGDSLFGFADLTGKVVIPPRFEEVGDFQEGRAKFAVDIDWAAARIDDGYDIKTPPSSLWTRFKEILPSR